MYINHTLKIDASHIFLDLASARDLSTLLNYAYFCSDIFCSALQDDLPWKIDTWTC